MCSHRCICSATDCGIRSGTRQVVGDSTPICQTSNCDVCQGFKKQPQNLYGKSLQSKNARINQLLCCCPAISDLCHLAKQTTSLSTEEVARHKKEVKVILWGLVVSGENKLNCMKNIGEMAEVAPKILCVQLVSGYSEFWTELRKIAKAINKQPNLECKIAALTYMRMHIPPQNPWWFYLTVAYTYQTQQDEIIRTWSSSQEGETSTS